MDLKSKFWKALGFDDGTDTPSDAAPVVPPAATAGGHDEYLVISAAFGLGAWELGTASKQARYTRPRALYIWMMREYYDLSYTHIAKSLDRDPSTIRSAYRSVEGLYRANAEFRECADRATGALGRPRVRTTERMR
jgi:hypothetical protein